MNLKNNIQEDQPHSATERELTIRALGLCKKAKKDPLLDALTLLASDISDSSCAAITILEKDYLWIESSFNFAVTEVPQEDSICFHGLNTKGIFAIEDLSQDHRFSSIPFVIDEPRLRSYAGAPLISKDGVKIGFLCVMDSRIKKLNAQQRKNLEIIAQQAMFVIESWQMEKETKEAQHKLEESQKYQRAVIENVPSMIYIKNAQKEMTYSLMNPACQNTFGVTESQIIGKKDTDFLPIQLAEYLSSNDLNAFNSRKVIKIDKEELTTALGQRFFTIYKVPLFDEKNQPKMLVVIMRDITEETQAKAGLEQERMKSIHSAKLASIGEISAGIAHEINNPLTVIAGSIVLLDQLKDNPEKFAAKSKTIFKSIERISKIVNNLKKFSRYSEIPVFAFVPISNIIKVALEMVDTKAKFLSIEIRTGTQVSVPIFCSELEIEQVIINLVNNSMDAIRNLPEKWIEISTFEFKGQIILRVQDSGNGISPEVEKKLFVPFFTTKPPGEGTGLGLSISKDILSQHQATIRLNRELAHTCFEISFPNVGVVSNAS